MRVIFIIVLLLQITLEVSSQSEVVTLSENMMTNQQEFLLADMDGWVFRSGSKGINDASTGNKIILLKPVDLSSEFLDKNGRLEGWFRLKFKLDDSLEDVPLYITRDHLISSDIYINNELVGSFGTIGNERSSFRIHDPFQKQTLPLNVHYDSINILDMHVVYYQDMLTPRDYRLKDHTLKTLISITGPRFLEYTSTSRISYIKYSIIWISVITMFMIVFWLLYFLNRNEKIFLYISILSTFIFLLVVFTSVPYLYPIDLTFHKLRLLVSSSAGALMTIFNLIVIEYIIKSQVSRLSKFLAVTLTITSVIAHLYDVTLPYAIFNTILWAYFIYLIWTHRSKLTHSQWTVVIGMVLTIVSALVYTSLNKISLDIFRQYDKAAFTAVIFSSPIPLLYYVARRFKELINDSREKAEKVIRLSQEKEQILSDQNKQLESQVEKRTLELKQSLEHLQATQAQLIHSEKMASLGELTAGIAHEIQNPLNFVNNFAEINVELTSELEEEIQNGDFEEVKALSKDIRQNEEKIMYHGKRAESIVKGMLQHSRYNSGEKNPTDINALADEYLRLAYHGFRAKDKSFNATFETEFDDSLEPMMVVPQEIGRVFLNLISNAFHAVRERSVQLKNKADYEPSVFIKTQKQENTVVIEIKDNGPGMTEEVKNKIFQPFFTTKPTGEGTGLGLSMSFDIIKSHGGKISVDTKEKQGTTFIIILPIVNPKSNT